MPGTEIRSGRLTVVTFSKANTESAHCRKANEGIVYVLRLLTRPCSILAMCLKFMTILIGLCTWEMSFMLRLYIGLPTLFQHSRRLLQTFIDLISGENTASILNRVHIKDSLYRCAEIFKKHFPRQVQFRAYKEPNHLSLKYCTFVLASVQPSAPQGYHCTFV